MTTLARRDISTFGPQVQTASHGGDAELEYFSLPPQRPEAVEDWATWLRSIARDPRSYEDDLVSAPSQQAIGEALVLLELLCHSGAPPDAITLGPNGEIVFERRAGEIANQIVIYDDLRVDEIGFRNGRLVYRRLIAEPAPVFAW